MEETNSNSNSTGVIARVPFKTVLFSVAGLWLAYFLLMTLRAELLGMDIAQDMVLPRMLTCLAGMLITLGLWVFLRIFDARPLWAKIAAALVFALPAAFLSMQANRVVFAELQSELDERILQEFVQTSGVPQEEVDDEQLEGFSQFLARGNVQYAIEITMSRYFMMLAWCALYLALLTGEKARAAERREQEFRNAAKAAELRSLRYQVNPHFLFNTLNSLSALVLTSRTQAAEKMIQMLSTFYRRSLAEDTTADVPLREEVALQRLYLEIEAVRFPLRLVAEYDVPADLENALIPGMILQPLVENSVKHAVAPSSGQVTIRISAREEYGRLVVSVSDNGNSRQVPDDVRPGFGIGLTNVRERLQARFGNEASIVSGHSAEGFTTHLRLPLLRMAEVVAA
ncbi:sensor histidine kinase [Erythrobacter sp. EC-HK427]|uniref:sensor histidine kinase n=1 Tax=Erythrobacter sp. EC-HK427 TaxID=2038396 RepID=UPI00125B64E4|nr:histidine kinase [Erythrobacter sp. EC-HK427]VVT03244.1 Sensor histidine kinase [Erythrobacter sp. EC-HK427]